MNTDQAQQVLTDGLQSVFDYGNIAVTVLVLCLIGSALVNVYMLRFIMGQFVKMIESIEKLNKVIGHDEH